MKRCHATLNCGAARLAVGCGCRLMLVLSKNNFKCTWTGTNRFGLDLALLFFHQHHENFCLWRCSAMAHISAKRWARSTWPWDGAEVRNRVWTPRWDPKMESHGRRANRRSRCEDFSGSKWMQMVQMPAGFLYLFGPRCGWWCIPIWRSQSLKFAGIVPTIWRNTCFCSVLGGFIFFILIFHRKHI